MKQLTFRILLTATLVALTWTAMAHEATQEAGTGARLTAVGVVDVVASETSAVEQVSERIEAVESAALEFPLTPDFAATEGGTCTPCSNHAQCAVACGGAGACLRDFGGECGGFPTDKYCFC